MNSRLSEYFVPLMICAALAALPMKAGAAESTNTAAVSSGVEKTKPCFNCQATGTIKCPTCKGTGQMDCPGPCIKLTKGTWIHMEVAGHPATDIWQGFPSDHPITYWNQNHMGDVIQMQNGQPVDIGKCTVCGGTAHVQCKTCKGTRQAVCNICEGKKMIPASWSAFDNPTLKNRPSIYHLKDGRAVLGRSMAVVGSLTWIRTETGQMELNTSDIVSVESQKSR
ncbi:MAG TPA: hypothetical protein VH598_06595 [Verrucomicrobiae bacterium]|nr:hypothetical protein [Verrucomicrobiae bacterium]